jgi:aspartyl-tRNA(Asn)/glutamyl-tRNA(Gln) amidotransferase subunit B
VLVDEPWIGRVRALLPELPTVRRDRFIAQLELPRYDAELLTTEKEIADYFEAVVAVLEKAGKKSSQENVKSASNWVMTDVLRVIGERKCTGATFPIEPSRLGGLIVLIQEGTISGSIAKQVFDAMLDSPDDPVTMVRVRGLSQVSDADAIGRIVDEVLAANAPQVSKYLEGSEKVFGYFVGETMRKMQGKGNPRMINELLRQKLGQKKA